jgi:hypothetical protein
MTEREKMIEAAEKAIRAHIKCDATGLSPAIASVFLTGFSDAARNALSAIEGMGCVVVPKEATEEMDEACCAAMACGLIVDGDFVEFGGTSAQNAWAAMLAKSPYAPKEADGD